MSSNEKILAILDLFNAQRPGWSFEELSAELGYTRSTLYRHLKMLTDAELVTSLPGIGFTLGPRIIELDYQLRTSDPLIRAARPVMEQLTERYPGVALLCRRYRRSVLCVHQVKAGDAVHSDYQRGRRRPLFRGAASVIILAWLPPHQLKRLYKDQAVDFENAKLGRSLAEVQTKLKTIREAGWMSTSGDVVPGNTGVACPLLDSGGDVIGSLSLTVPTKVISEKKVAEIADQVVFCSSIVNKALESER